MATVKVTLRSVGYPKLAPNCLLVLQSLMREGFRVIMKDCKYKDRDAIKEYFEEKNINMEFVSTNNADIFVNETYAYVGEDLIEGCTPENIWKKVDQLCLKKQIYERDTKTEFIPAYKQDKFFVVADYCLANQTIYTNNITLRSAKMKGEKLFKLNRSINTIDVVDATTFKVVAQFNKKLKKFDGVSDNIYFSIL